MNDSDQHPRSAEEGAATATIERTIQGVERLYNSLTGHAPPAPEDLPRAQIPPERDPEGYVTEQLEALLRAVGSPSSPLTPQWAPRASCRASEAAYLLDLDLPGVAREALRVDVRARQVIVSGARPSPTTEPLLWCERPRGRFQRAIELPSDAALDRIEARLEDGVLRLEVPRSAGQPHRSVSVR